jgi:DNA-binding response OmpR family regulator
MQSGRLQSSQRGDLLTRPEPSAVHVMVVDPAVDGRALRLTLESRGVRVTHVASTVDGLVEFGRTLPVAVVVAPDTPGITPASFVQAIRRHGSPFVVAVLSLDHRDDVGELMLAGSSAVIERPYDGNAVWDLLRRSHPALEDQALLSLGPLELDTRAYAVRVRGARMRDLPLKEFELLRTLMVRAPEVVSNDDIRAAVWGAEGEQIPDNTLAVHVARLRARLQGIATIRRLRGRGYALSAD